MKRLQKGFTLIELLIVVAIIGIIAAIAIPNLLNAIQRGKQKRTMSDLRTVATSNESYAIDNNFYAARPSTAANVSVLKLSLEPTYIKKLPLTDGWANQMKYWCDTLGSEYTVVSYAKDGAATGPASGATTDFRHDIVFSTGSFVTWPEGTQN